MEKRQLNLYCSSGKGSKSYWAFEALEKSWPYGTRRYRNDLADDGIHVFWGLVGQNSLNIKEAQKRRQPFIFIDMPYWNRWMPGMDPKDSHWRIIVNALHVDKLEDRSNDRCKHIELKPWKKDGDHILICPSSLSLNQFYDQPKWLLKVCNKLKQITDRPIKIREKPRSDHTSGPAAAKIPLEEDLKNAYCTITLASIVGVESLINGIPAISEPFGPIGMLGNTNIENIESIKLPQRQQWLNTLSYNQWSISEIEQGLPIQHILEKLNA